MVGGSIFIVLILFIVYLMLQRKKKGKRFNRQAPIDLEEMKKSDTEGLLLEKLSEEDERE